MDIKFINAGLVWTSITSTVAAILWVMNTFASAADVENKVKSLKDDIDEVKLNQAYGQYYDRMDDYDEAVAEGREALAKEYAKQMERLKAVICESDPEWERCD